MPFGRRCVCQPYSWLRALYILVLKMTTGCRENTSYAECSSRNQGIWVSFCKPRVTRKFWKKPELFWAHQLPPKVFPTLMFTFPALEKCGLSTPAMMVSSWFWACFPFQREQASSKIETNSSKFCSIRLCMGTEPVTKSFEHEFKSPFTNELYFSQPENSKAS